MKRRRPADQFWPLLFAARQRRYGATWIVGESDPTPEFARFRASPDNNPGFPRWPYAPFTSPGYCSTRLVCRPLNRRRELVSRVEQARIELATFCLPDRCSTKLSYGPRWRQSHRCLPRQVPRRVRLQRRHGWVSGPSYGLSPTRLFALQARPVTLRLSPTTNRSALQPK